MPSIVRTHDVFYLDEDRYHQPKQMFVDIIDAMRPLGADRPGAVIADFGCAAGEFAFALRESFPSSRIEGYDLLEELLVKARRMVPAAVFHGGSVLDHSICPAGHADFSLCVGVLSIFDTFEPLIENLLSWTKPGGHVFLQGLFNDHPVDVNVKYSLSGDYAKGVLESGWNLFSKQTVTRWLHSRLDVLEFSFTDFVPEFDLARRDDPVRSWTITGADGKRIVTNGLCLLQPHSILHLQKR